MYLFRLNLERLCERAHYRVAAERKSAQTGRARSLHAHLAYILAAWLIGRVPELEERGYAFEAATTEQMADSLRDFARRDGTAEGLATLWNEMGDWASATVITGTGREKELCELPVLPDDFSC